MSKTIDERVVEMRFDNKQFESNVATSMSTLDKLKKSLDLDGAAKGFDNLSDAAKNCDMSTFGRSVEAVSSQFSALETIAVGALLKIGSQVATTGEQLVKSLTIDQISEGWTKYADKTTSVQTIMAATGKSIDEVNGSLEKLIWFTDETSYSLTDMTSNIGKFTSQGIDLDTSVTAMEGISTWASLSGGSINEASRAMYNLSQALGVGAVKLQDWKSIENANMATKEFKEMAMEAAVATGDLTKSFDAAGNAIYETSKGTEVTAANFSSTLSDAWFTSDALLSVLNNYGSYADGIYELYNNLGDGVEKTTSEIIQDMKDLKGADDQTILNAGYTEDQIELVRQLSEEVGGLGQKSFAAAQEAKTFSEVITSVKEAVASGWAQTFELIFGNYEEAKVLWTDLANSLWDVFASGGEARNEMLKEALSVSGFDRFTQTISDAGIELDTFETKLSEIADGKGLSIDDIISEYGSLEKAVQAGAISTDLLTEAVNGCADGMSALDFKNLQEALDGIIDGVDDLTGREHLVNSFWNVWEGVGTLLSTVKDAFREIFPATTAEQLYSFVAGLDEMTSRFKTFLTESEEGQKLLTDLKNTFKGIFAVLDIVKQAFSGLIRAIAPAGSAVSSLLSGVLGLTGGLGSWISSLDETIKKNDIFYKAFKTIVDFIKGAITTVRDFASAIGEKLNLPSLEEAKETIKDFLELIKEKFAAPGFELLSTLFENICKRANQVKDAITKMKDGVVSSFESVDNAVSGSKFVQVLTGIWNLVKTVASAITTLFGKAISGLIDTLSNADFNSIMDLLNALATGGLVVAIKKFVDMASDFKGTVGSFLDWAKEFGTGINKILDGVRGCLEAWQTNLKASALLKIAGAIAILAAGLLVLSTIDSGKLTASLAAITTLFVELMGSMAIMDKTNINSKSINKTSTAMVKIGAALLIMSAALKNIAELEPEQMAVGLAGIAGLAAIMDAAIIALQAASNKYKEGSIKGLITFAAAIGLLAISLKSIAKLGWDGIAKGLTGIAGLAVIMSATIIALEAASSKYKDGSIKGLLSFAIAIDLLTISFKSIAELDWSGVAKGLTGIAGMAAVMAATIIALEAASNKYKDGSIKGLLSFAIAIDLLTISFKFIADEDWNGIAKGLTGLAGMAAVMGVTIVALQAASSKYKDGSVKGLITFAAAIGVLTISFKAIADEDWSGIAKGLTGVAGLAVVMVGALAALTAVSATFNEASMLKVSSAMLVMSAAILVLTPAMKTLGAMSWESIAKGLVTIAGAFTVMGVAGAVLGPLAPTILALSGALALIGVSAVAIGAGLTLIGTGLTSVSIGLTALATALSTSVTVIVAGLSAIIIGIAGLIPAIAQQIGEAIVEFCGVIAKGAPAIAEAVKAVVLSLIDVLVECVPAIADGALTLVAGVLNSLVTFAPQIIDSLMQFLIEILEGIARNIPQLIQAAMDVIGAFFEGVLSALSNIDSDSLIKGVAAIGLLTALVAALGAVAGLIPAALVGVAGMGVVIAELALVLAAVGALAQIPGLSWLITEGGSLLQTIGEAIGGFIGGIVGGFMTGVSSSFPQIGTDLSAFMTNVQPFIDGASKITPDLLSGIANLTGAILLITAADLLEGLTSWLTGGSSLADFGNELVPFGESMVQFSNSISGLDADLVDKAATAGKTLAEMAATLPNSGGVVGFFTGENDMDKFGEQLVTFGGAMMEFADAVNGLDTEAVQNAAIAGKAMAEMAATLPNTGGAVAFFTGNNDMDTFGEQLVPFGKAIKEYSDAVSGLDVDAVTNSATAGAALVELANTVPNTGGAVAFFTGDNDLATFGEQIVEFGKAMKEYSEAVSGIDGDAVANSASAGAALVELANTIPNTGGLVSFFTGDNDLETFGEQLVPFGEGMKAYSDSLAGFNAEAVEASASAGQALASLQSSLPNVGGLVDFFTGGNDLEKFAEGIIPFGEAMKEYGDSVSGLENHAEAIDASVIAGTALSELSKTLPDIGGILDFFTGGNDLGTFSDGIVEFGEAMKEYGEAVSGLEDYSTAIDASIIAGQSLIELSKTLPNVGGAIEFFSGTNDLGSFSTGIIDFGKAMKGYAEAVTGLEEYSGSIDASVIAGGSLIELSKTLPNVSSAIEFFSGTNDLGSFSTGIVDFGEAMKGYAEVVSGLENYTGSIDASVVAGSSLIELSKTLPNVGGAIQFFNGNSDLSSFSTGIVDFGNAMRDYGDAVSGLETHTSAIEASVIAGNSLVELSKTLPSSAGAVDFFTGQSEMAAFGANVVPFGSAMKDYGDAVAGLEAHTSAIEASVIAGGSLAELAKTLPSSGGAVSFFTGGNDLATFSTGIVPFGEAMRDYGNAVAGLEAHSGAIEASAIAGKSLVELANTLPKCGGLAQVFTGENSLASFGDELVEFGKDLSAYAEAIADVQPDTVTASANAAKALSDLATGLPDSSLFDQWFGGDQTLSSFGKEISSFGTEMSSYYSKVSGIDTAKLSSVITQVWSLVDLANGVQSINTSGMTSFGNSLKTMGDTGVREFISAFENSISSVNSAIQSMLNAVSASIADGKNLTTPGMESVMAALAEVVTKKATEINASVTKMMSGMYTTIRNTSNSAKSAMQTVMIAALNGVSSYTNQFYTLGSNAGQGFVNGISSKMSASTSAGRSLALAALNAAQKALDSHSPSREFIYLGENMGEGLAIGAQNSIVPAEQATSTMIDEVLSVASKGIDAFEEWAEEKKYYDELSLSDELAGYEKLQTMYAEGSEERKKIDREVYSLQNDLVASTYQASLDWIETEKYYNRLSTQEELEAYERMQKRYIEGSEERIAIDKKVYELRNQLIDESYQNSMDWIEEEKYYNRLSLAEELAAYKRVQSRYEQGTDERKELDREVYSLEQEIYEAQQQYIADVQSAQESANEKRLELEEEYADKVKSINEQLESDIESAWKSYEDSVESRTKTLYNSYGLFDAVSEKDEVSGETLMQNLEDQVQEFGEWQDILSSLSARGLDEELIEELQEMGPSAIAQIKALNNMSDSELEKYVSLWSIKHAQAREQATSELEGLRDETLSTIEQLRADAETELSEYQATWQTKMDQITEDCNAELEQLRKDFGEKVGLIKTDTETEMQEMADAAQAILTAAGWDETGQQIVTGLTEGVEENKAAFLGAITQMALEAVEAVEETLDINSPSKVFRELGNFTSLGFVKGITDYAAQSYDAGCTVGESAKDGLSEAMQTVSDYMNGDMEIQPTIRPVLDLTNVMQNAGTLNSMFDPSRILALAGETSLAFSAAAGNSQMQVTVDNDGVVQELRSLRSEMAEMTERMERMRIYLDTGAMVGAMTDPMDTALGQKNIYKRRGI